jgi:hypothetical protein
MKDIVAMLADIIYMLCDGNREDTLTLIRCLTDITPEELQFFNIIYPKEDE